MIEIDCWKETNERQCNSSRFGYYRKNSHKGHGSNASACKSGKLFFLRGGGSYSKLPPQGHAFFFLQQSPLPKDGRFGPKFSNPRAHPMRGGSIPHRGVLRALDPTLAPILWEGTWRSSLRGGLYCKYAIYLFSVQGIRNLKRTCIFKCIKCKS